MLEEYVIAKPYTSKKTITIVPSNDDDDDDDAKIASFIIVGCDGLWDVIQDQEAVDFVLKRIAEKELVSFLPLAEGFFHPYIILCCSRDAGPLLFVSNIHLYI